MKWIMVIIAIFTSFAALSQEAKVKTVECYCTDKNGARVELGTTICMHVGGRDFIARCEMSLNNPMWRELSQGCLSSQNQNTLDDAPLIHS